MAATQRKRPVPARIQSQIQCGLQGTGRGKEGQRDTSCTDRKTYNGK